MAPSSKIVHMNQEELTAIDTLTTLCRSLTSSPPTALPVVQTPMPFIPALPTVTLPLDVPNSISPILTIRPSLKQSETKINTNKDKKKFPERLLEILDSSEYSNIIKWLPGGKAFVIVDKKHFTNELPAFLQQTQHTSFTRKLFRWKFVRVTRGLFIGAYYHKLFRRDQPALCKLMSCINIVPSLDEIAQTRQQSRGSISTSRRPNVTNLSISQLQILKEAKRVFRVKHQLLNIHLKRAHLYEQQKKIQKHVKASQTVLGPQARQHPLRDQSPDSSRFYTNGNGSKDSSRILQDAYRVLKSDITMEYNASYLSQLTKLRQTRIL